jgi:hypothetical protein
LTTTATTPSASPSPATAPSPQTQAITSLALNLVVGGDGIGDATGVVADPR